MSGEASITTSVSSRTQNLALIAVILCFQFLGPAEAMIRTLPLDELVRSSHYIVIADVARSDEIADEILSGGFRIVRLRHELTLVEALKGSWLPEAPIVNVLVEKGLVERLSGGGRSQVYGLTPSELLPAHPHFHSRGCAALQCLQPGSLIVDLRGIQRSFAGEIQGVAVRVDGICKNCLKRS